MAKSSAASGWRAAALLTRLGLIVGGISSDNTNASAFCVKSSLSAEPNNWYSSRRSSSEGAAFAICRSLSHIG